MNAEYWHRPVLQSVTPVIEQSHHVATLPEGVERVAGWMAYEEFHFPSGAVAGPFDMGSDPDRIMDVILLVSTLNFAFTDFDTSVKFVADYRGKMWSDTEAMYARLHEAITGGTPMLDGAFLASVTRAELQSIFKGNIEMPMLEERAAILNEVGETLLGNYGGSFHRFVRDCAPAMYADGDGLLERLVVEFPRFNDVSSYKGADVEIHKLPQLCLWSLHIALASQGGWSLSDLGSMTAFADYILPVALRLMGITKYSDSLEQRINDGVMIERDSEEEIELRAHTIYATALLTDAINELRPPDMQLILPQVDYRLWKTYHATFWPHHLTRTTMY